MQDSSNSNDVSLNSDISLQPDQVTAQSQSSSMEMVGLPPASCEVCWGPVDIRAEYDDYWRTPITDRPIFINDRFGDVLPWDINNPVTIGQKHLGSEDGDHSVFRSDDTLGTFSYPKVARGSVTVALVPDPSAEDEIDSLVDEIASALDAFKGEMETSLKPWILEWNTKGILSIPEALRTGQLRGLTNWWKDEAGFWASAWQWASNTFDAAISQAVGAANSLQAWYDELPWYDKADPLGAAAREMIQSAWEEANELWARKDQIMDLIKGFVEGSSTKIQQTLDALSNLPGEVGDLIRLIALYSVEWTQSLNEMLRETGILQHLAVVLLGTVMLMTPNLWAEAIGTVQGYLLPEVILAIIAAIITALSASAGSSVLVVRLTAFVKKVKGMLEVAGKIGPIILKIFAKFDEIAGLITDLSKSLRRAINQISEGATNTTARVIRPSHPLTPKQRLASNRARGKLAEKQAVQDLQSKGYTIVGEQVYVKTPNTGRYMDIVARDPQGNLRGFEVKAGQAMRSTTQAAKDLDIASGLGTFGKNAPGGLAGTNTSIPTQVLQYPNI